MHLDNTPKPFGELVYRCIGCGRAYDIHEFIYTCPSCKSLLRIENKDFDKLKQTSGSQWADLFDARIKAKELKLMGIFRFHELILPIIPIEDIIYLGEGNTPMVQANKELSTWVGCNFLVKMEGLNPSASFKDRGMASAISYLNHVIRVKNLDNVLGICASTGDTSASAALYMSYLPKTKVKSVVLLPEGKVTPQQLSQPLGSGAIVIELPGVFDDCMQIVEELANDFNVFLLNSKNPVRIQGQKTYAYEVAQQLGWNLDNLALVVPVGNAGNITAIMEGFVDLYELGIINELPTMLAVQSYHADPIVKWRLTGNYQPIKVKPSVAQAAMIGDPVSFPKVAKLVQEYFSDRFYAIQLSEDEIMEGMLMANRHGHVVCTQGGESIAGLKKAIEQKIIEPSGRFVVDSTSHQLKFASFQQMYFENRFDPGYEISPKDSFKNSPIRMEANASIIADFLGLQRK